MRIHRDPALIAYQVAEETRALVTATAEPTALEDVAAVRDVTESLQLTTSQLPACLRQLSAALRHLEEADAVTTGTGEDAAEEASLVLRALLNAEVGLTLARAALREAETPLTQLATPASRGQDATAAR